VTTPARQESGHLGLQSLANSFIVCIRALSSVNFFKGWPNPCINLHESIFRQLETAETPVTFYQLFTNTKSHLYVGWTPLLWTQARSPNPRLNHLMDQSSKLLGLLSGISISCEFFRLLSGPLWVFPGLLVAFLLDSLLLLAYSLCCILPLVDAPSPPSTDPTLFTISPPLTHNNLASKPSDLKLYNINV
jgi:hypothetical protein